MMVLRYFGGFSGSRKKLYAGMVAFLNMESGKVKVTIYLSADVNSTLKSYSAEVKKNLKSQSEVIEEALIEFFEKRNYPLKKG